MELANQQALLAEELTDEEVRGLLERLNAREFGGSENATVGAVVEATGADVTVVGRLLAEIRKEDFEEKFGLQLKDHGLRIETLEEKTKRVESAVKKPEKAAALDHYQLKALDRLAEQERQGAEIKPSEIIFLAVLLMAVMLFLVYITYSGPS